MPISASNRYPRVFLSVLFGYGPQATTTAPRNIVITGYAKKVGTGQAQANIDNVLQGPLLNADEASAYWGFGSEMHRFVDAALDQNTDISLYGVSYAEAVGGAYNEQTFVITNNNGANAGSLLMYFEGNPKYLEVPIAAAATPAAQATAIYNAMTLRKELPMWVPAAPAAGSVVFRSNHKGARSNLIAVRWVQDGISGSTYSISTTNVGATDSDPSTALDVLANQRAFIIVCPDNSTSASVGVPKWVSYANQRADPLYGLRGIIVAAHTGTLGQATALSTSVNAHRCTIAWCKNAEDPPGRIAARYAVFITKLTETDPSTNMIFGGADQVTLKNFRGPFADADRISEGEATQALNVGLTPIRTYKNQPSVGLVTRPITSRFQDLTGNPDYACLNLSCVLVPDDIANDLEADIPRTFAGWKLAEDDPTEPNQEPLPNVLYPSLFDEELKRKLRIRASLAQLVKVEASIAAGHIRSMIHPGNPDRILTPNIPLQVINWFAQWEGTLRQTTKAA